MKRQFLMLAAATIAGAGAWGGAAALKHAEDAALPVRVADADVVAQGRKALVPASTAGHTARITPLGLRAEAGAPDLSKAVWSEYLDGTNPAFLMLDASGRLAVVTPDGGYYLPRGVVIGAAVRS